MTVTGLLVTKANINFRFSARAILCKRHGDAMLRVPLAKPEFVAKLAPDHLSGVITMTDSILQFLYSFWCLEQSTNGLPVYANYATTLGMIESNRCSWEAEARRSENDQTQREMNRGMAGLL